MCSLHRLICFTIKLPPKSGMLSVEQELHLGNIASVIVVCNMWLQKKRRSKQPLVIHACTSSQKLLTTGQFFQHIQAYFSAHPPPFRVIMGPYPKYQGWNIVRNDHIRAARSAAAEVKFAAICGVLRAVGQPNLAKKMHSGWKVCMVNNTCLS